MTCKLILADADSHVRYDVEAEENPHSNAYRQFRGVMAAVLDATHGHTEGCITGVDGNRDVHCVCSLTLTDRDDEVDYRAEFKPGTVCGRELSPAQKLLSRALKHLTNFGIPVPGLVS